VTAPATRTPTCCEWLTWSWNSPLVTLNASGPSSLYDPPHASRFVFESSMSSHHSARLPAMSTHPTALRSRAKLPTGQTWNGRFSFANAPLHGTSAAWNASPHG
jgi:hypothetical protein